MDNKTPNTPLKDKELSKWLAVTFTYSNIKNKTPYGQFKETVIKLIQQLQESCDYEIIPEWRMTSGEIHYHGIIYILLPDIWLTKTLPFLKRNGFVKIKTIDDMPKWTQYYNKNRILAESITKLQMPIRQQVIVEKVCKKVIDIPDGDTIMIEKDVLKQT